MSVINHTYGFIFVHIPKNAGTSVAHALSSLTTWRDLELGATELGEAIGPHFRHRFGIGKHAMLREIAALVGESQMPRYLTFAVARHPVARTASTWGFLRRWTAWQSLPPFRAYAESFLACDSLDAFVASPFFDTPGPDRILLPQSEWMVRDATGIISIDRILRIDRLEFDLSAALTDAGVPPDRIASLDLPILNATAHGPQRAQLSPGSMDRLVERYRRDFALLGYEPDESEYE